MVKLGGSLCLLLKLVKIPRITGQSWGQQLNRDFPNWPAISSLVQRRLAARPQALFEGVSIGQLLSYEVRQFRNIAAKAEASGSAEPDLGIQW
jgi:hypothetical protein